MTSTTRLSCLLLLAIGVLGAQVQAAGEAVYLADDLYDRMTTRQDVGQLGYNTSVRARPWELDAPLKIGEKTYEKGLGLHANGEIAVELNGMFEEFRAAIGVQPPNGSGGPVGAVVFEVYVDGELRFESPVMSSVSEAVPIEISVAGADELRLEARHAGEADAKIAGNLANWVEARLTLPAGETFSARQTPMDIAPFARVVTSDPSRVDGAKAGRLEEFAAEDVFLEWEVPSDDQGLYLVSRTEDGRGTIGLLWPERRTLSQLTLKFANAKDVPEAEQVEVQYWSSQGRVDDWTIIGQTMWQGEWTSLPGTLKDIENGFVLEVDKGVPEFRNQNGTLKIRWIFPQEIDTVAIERLGALTRSWWETTSIRAVLENPPPGKSTEVAVYNGYFVQDNGGDVALSCEWKLEEPLSVQLRYNSVPDLPDRTVLQFQLPDGNFGIAVEDVLEHGAVYVEDFGLLVTPANSDLTPEAYVAQIAGKKTTRERVHEHPDQTLGAAMSLIEPIANEDPILLSLACDNVKYELGLDGTLAWVEGSGAIRGHAKASPDKYPGVTFFFGSGEAEWSERRIDHAWMPVVLRQERNEGLIFSQRVYVAPFGGTAGPDEVGWLNSKPLAIAEVSIENTTDKAVPATVGLAFQNADAVAADSTGAVASLDEVPFAFVRVDGDRLDATVDTGNANVQGLLPPHTLTKFIVYLPGWSTEAADEAAFTWNNDEIYRKFEQYWDNLFADVMQIDVPDAYINDLYRVSQVHCLLAARNEAEGARVEPWIASRRYGALDTEAQAVIYGMDITGHSEFARRSHDYFLDKYNDDGYLARGYTVVGTGQHLWALSRHYDLTRDQEWLQGHAPQLVKALEWMKAQREKTKRLTPAGEKVPEFGLIPPGVLADWERYAYYFYGQGFYYAGMAGVADALADIGYLGAEEFVSEAAAFKEDILRAYRWNQARMPVFSLADGTWVPAYPSSLYTFGLTSDFFMGTSSIGHDVEVGANHLMHQGVLDPNSLEGEWIMDYMEDRWFYRPHQVIDYSPEQLEEDWFTRGGFSKLQQYYTRNADVYALQDEPKLFIRTYFNSIFPTLSGETKAFWEHYNNRGGWNKTAETGWFLVQSALMMSMRKGDDLWLAHLLPMQWLRDGETVSVRNAPTDFGRVSFSIDSQVDDGYIDMEIAPPLRQAPGAIVLRPRHPNNAEIKSVKVDGRLQAVLDPSASTVRLSGDLSKPFRVHLAY